MKQAAVWLTNFFLTRYGGYGSYQGEGSQEGGYGHSYQSYHRQNDSLKGKIEQKYWKTKQKMIEKLKKDQDEFVVAGDAEVDARLEVIYAFLRINCFHCYFNQ